MNAALTTLRRHAGGVDAPVAVILALLAILAVATPEQLRVSLVSVADNLLAVAPFLLLSVAIAAYASATGADNLIARAFRGRTLQMVFVAALFGALSPFCSCGVIPLIAALLAVGVPLAPVMAFWLASPVMDPSMFVLTAGTLGVHFAIAKTMAAVGLGLAGGFGIWAMMRLGLVGEPLRPEVTMSACAAERLRNPGPVVWRFWTEGSRIEKFTASALGTLVFLGKWLTLAFLLESLMIAYIPGETIAGMLGDGGVATTALAALVGVPAYLNGFAALPLMAGLIGQGMDPGVAMAFMVAGGVTSVPAAIAVFALARLPVFLAYVGFALTGALLSGLIYGLTV